MHLCFNLESTYQVEKEKNVNKKKHPEEKNSARLHITQNSVHTTALTQVQLTCDGTARKQSNAACGKLLCMHEGHQTADLDILGISSAYP